MHLNTHDFPGHNMVSPFIGFIAYIFFTIFNCFSSLVTYFSFEPNTIKAELILGTIRLFFGILVGIGLWFTNRFLNNKFK